jgi:tetratricopeptide (TPR) repeat protein
LAADLTQEVQNFGDEMDESVKEKKLVEGYALALKAKELDPDNPLIYSSLAMYAWVRHDWEGARHACETGISLAPKNPAAYDSLAFVLNHYGENKRAIELLTRAINLDPKHPHEYIFWNMGESYFMLGDNDTAIDWFEKFKETNSGRPFIYASLAMAYALKGEDAKTRAAAAEFHRLAPDDTLSKERKDSATEPPAYREYFENKIVPAWRKAGLPE